MIRKLHRFEILVRWFGEYLTINNYRPRTISDYQFELSLFRRWLDKQHELDDIDDLKKEHFYDYTATLYERKLAITTIGHKLAVLRSFFSTLYKENKLYCDFTTAIVMPRIGRQLPRNILSLEEVEKLFEVLEKRVCFAVAKTRRDAKALRDHAIIEVLYSSGLRHSEIKQLKLEHVNYDQSLLFIHNGKGGKDRFVPLGTFAVEAVARYVQEGRRFLINDQSEDTLFLSQLGSKLGKDTIQRILKRSLCEAGVDKHIRVHDLRHTCATHMVNGGADIRYVQELLGHSNLSATQIYTHVAIDDLKKKHEKYHPRERWCD